LESRVAERTAALVKANQELAAEITERKHAEEEQERLAEQLRAANSMLLVANLQAQDRARDAERRAAELDAAIAAIADGIAITDPESRIIRMNAAAERVLGLTGEEARRPLAERLRLERVETVDGRPFPLEEMPIWRALRYGETNSGVIMIIHNARTGEGTWVSNSSAPIRAADGSILGAITVYADITAVHNLQEQREDLLRAVSHDLRSPLQVIQGQAQYLLRILERSGHDGVEQNSARSIIAGAKRMNAMIQDLVDSAQMEAGQLPLEDQPLDLRAFLIDLLRRNSGVLAVQRVKVEIPENLPHVDADPNRLERIFVNLLSNALKYSAPGTSVLVGATPTDREVTVSVADRGIGINSEDIPRLFQRYARTKRAGRIEGIGLGLYITRLLVEAHGGRIWVDSTPDEGSTFYFSLPLKEGRTAVPE
jgi:PAS domain S-box-containing protein